MTEGTLAVIREGATKGLSIPQCALYAGVSHSTLYDYINANPDFSEEIKQLRENIKMRARLLLSDSIAEQRNLESAKYVLEKTDAEYQPKSKIDVSNTDGTLAAAPIAALMATTQGRDALRQIAELVAKEAAPDASPANAGTDQSG